VNVTIIGFGEAGPVFGKTLLAAGMQVVAYDRLQHVPEAAERQLEKTLQLGITPASSITEAVTGCDLVISTVTASESINAAEAAAVALNSNQTWLDLNSVSPQSKAAISKRVTDQGASFVEGVAMDTVPAKGAAVPLLLCGPKAAQLSDELNQAGLNARAVSTALGTASSIKMLRSVIIKGMESLFAESIEAGAALGIHEEVIESLQATYPSLDWQQVAGYQLSRASIHASRRAAEMRESAVMIDALGMEPVMALAIAAKQQNLADRNIGSGYTGNTVDDFVDAVRQ